MARRRYQRGALRKENGKWLLRWREDISVKGEVRRVERRAVIGTIEQIPTKPLARRAADKMLGAINPINYRPGQMATVAEFAAVYLQDAVPMLKPSNQSTVRGIVNKHIVPFLGDSRLHEIAGRLPQAFVVEMMRRKLRRKTILNVLSVLSRMLDIARGYGYLAAKLDYGLIQLPPEELDSEVRCFTPAEAQKIIDNAEGIWKVCFALMAYLGLRCGEALGLAWDHIDLDIGVIYVRQNCVHGKIQTLKSKTSRREVPLPAHLIAMLRNYHEEWTANPFGLLFVTDRGTPFWSTNVRLYRFYPLLERLGIDHGGLHAFRHGVATTALQMAHASVPTVRDTLGHADIRTTLRYTHRVSEEQRKAVESVSAEILRHSAANVRPKSLTVQ